MVAAACGGLTCGARCSCTHSLPPNTLLPGWKLWNAPCRLHVGSGRQVRRKRSRGGQSFVLRLGVPTSPARTMLNTHTHNTHTHSATPSSSTAQRSTRPPRSVGTNRTAPPPAPPDAADAAMYAPLQGSVLTSGPVAHMLKVS